MSDTKTETTPETPKIQYIFPPSNKIAGTHLPFLGYQYIDDMTIQFNTKSNIELLFKEIFNCGKPVSDIKIQSNRPIVVQAKGQGLVAVSQVLDNTQAKIFVETLLGDSSPFAIISTREKVSGACDLVISQTQQQEVKVGKGTSDGRIVREQAQSTVLTEIRTATSFRYELTACLGGFTFTLRPLANKIPNVRDLKIEPDYVKPYFVRQGICVISGATGTGKSTTLTAIMNESLTDPNSPLKGIYITLENPIEMRYDNIESPHSQVVQKQIGYGGHLKTFADGVHSAMREAPVLILVGELRDRETITSALECALTGHTVYTTVHANNVGAILPRLIAQVSVDDVSRVLDALRILSAQKIITKKDGSRTSVREWLTFTPYIIKTLSQFLDTPLVLCNMISQMMQDPAFEREYNADGVIRVRSFKTQADELFANDEIDQQTYDYLCDTDPVVDDKLKAVLEQMSKRVVVS